MILLLQQHCNRLDEDYLSITRVRDAARKAATVAGDGRAWNRGWNVGADKVYRTERYLTPTRGMAHSKARTRCPNLSALRCICDHGFEQQTPRDREVAAAPCSLFLIDFSL